MTKKVCSVDDCSTTTTARGLCRKHYMRWTRTGGTDLLPGQTPRSRQIEHGTYGGYQQCKKRPEGPCDPCRVACREYMGQWRERNPDKAARHGDRADARSRAATRLARMHPAVFRALVAEEMAKGRERQAGAA